MNALRLMFSFSLFTILTETSMSQLPNHDTILLKNLNEHYTSTEYSAMWGYSASDGREYAMLGCPDGTAFVDITDTTDIHEVDFQPGPVSAWREMKTFSHYAYIVSEAGQSALQIVDLQYLPDSVHFVKKFAASTHSTTHTISQNGPFLYLNGCNINYVSNGGIVVYDLSADPENPVVRGKWTEMYVHDCRIVRDTIYAANIFTGKVSIIDAVNKDSLRTITSFVNLPGSGPHNTAVTYDRRRLFVTDEIGTAPHMLKVWNIENLSSITFVNSWQPTGIGASTVHNIEIYGAYAVIAHYTAGIRILDISNPDVPAEIAWYDTYPSDNGSSYNGCWGVYLFPSGKIAASDKQTGLYVIRTNFTITSSETHNQNSIVNKFDLRQNFPNPFNPSTSISFDLKEASDIELAVYNSIGEKVVTIAGGHFSKGDYKYRFDADTFDSASGIYFYRLIVNGISDTKKMLLLK